MYAGRQNLSLVRKNGLQHNVNKPICKWNKTKNGSIGYATYQKAIGAK